MLPSWAISFAVSPSMIAEQVRLRGHVLLLPDPEERPGLAVRRVGDEFLALRSPSPAGSSPRPVRRTRRSRPGARWPAARTTSPAYSRVGDGDRRRRGLGECRRHRTAGRARPRPARPRSARHRSGAAAAGPRTLLLRRWPPQRRRPHLLAPRGTRLRGPDRAQARAVLWSPHGLWAEVLLPGSTATAAAPLPGGAAASSMSGSGWLTQGLPAPEPLSRLPVTGS